MPQYVFECLGIHGTGHEREQQVALTLASIPPPLAATFIFPLLGIFAQRIGSLKALKIFALLSVAAQCGPVLLQIVPDMRLVPLVGIFLSVSMAPLVPLATLLCAVVPSHRLGEATGVLGASKSLSSLMAYALTATVSEVLLANQQSG